MDDMTENTALNWRRYEDGNQSSPEWVEKIHTAGHSHQCPTYVHRTPPCQGSCPSGHDIRGHEYHDQRDNFPDREAFGEHMSDIDANVPQYEFSQPTLVTIDCHPRIAANLVRYFLSYHPSLAKDG